MPPAPNDPATWVRLPIDRTRLFAGNRDLDVFEIGRYGGATTPQFDAYQVSGSGRQLDLVINSSSNQGDSEKQPSTTKTYMKRTKPWLDNMPQNLSSLPAFVDQLISLFFSHHVLTTDVYTTSLPGYLEELPSMYHAASIDSALVESVKAASLMGALSRNELKVGSYFHATALRSYSQALRKLRIDLHEPQTATNDATMMTILMLDQMETYCFPDRSLPLGPHFAGLIHVMQARGNSQLFSKRGWSLFRIAHHRLACQWQWHHGAHIMLLETLRCALSRMQSFQSESDLSTTRSRVSQCTNTVIRLAYDILAAVPQLLGIVDAAGELIVTGSENVCVKQIGGYFAMFAMEVVKDVPSTTGQQKQAAAETLRGIRGIRPEPRPGPG